MHLSIHLQSFPPSIQLPVSPSLYLFIFALHYPSIWSLHFFTLTHFSIHLQSFLPSIHPSVCSSFYPSNHSSFYPSTLSFISSSTCSPFLHLFLNLVISVFIPASLKLSPSLHLSIPSIMYLFHHLILNTSILSVMSISSSFNSFSSVSFWPFAAAYRSANLFSRPHITPSGPSFSLSLSTRQRAAS